MFIMMPPASSPGDLKYYWKDASGTLRNFSRNDSPNLFVPVGSAGLGMAKFDVESDKLPFSPGRLLRQINTEARRLTIPIVVHEDNIGDAVDVAQDLHDWFDTGDEEVIQPGTFRIIRPDGEGREIEAFYIDGLDGDMKEGGPHWFQYVLNLLCLDPWPRALEDTVVTKTVAQASSFAVMNMGTRFAYPIWTIHGAFNDVTIENTTTGKVLATLAYDLPTDNQLTIDTRPSDIRPGYSVYDLGGNNRLYKMDPEHMDFWTLKPGSNSIEITFGGGTDSNTLVTLTYRKRYKSLLR